MISLRDLKPISETFTELVSDSDRRRRDLLKLLLTIYTPVSSGLFYLSLTANLVDVPEKMLFLVISLAAILIVLGSLSVFLLDFLSATEVARKFTNYVNDTGKHPIEPLYPKEWHSKLMTITMKLVVFTLFVNILGVLAFIIGRMI